MLEKLKPAGQRGWMWSTWMDHICCSILMVGKGGGGAVIKNLEKYTLPIVIAPDLFLTLSKYPELLLGGIGSSLYQDGPMVVILGQFTAETTRFTATEQINSSVTK